MIDKIIKKFIKEYIEEHGYVPSYDEIAAAVCVTKSTVYSHIKKLLYEGELETDVPGGHPRAFRLSGYKVRLIKENEVE